MSWRDHAACLNLPNILFYPPSFKEDRKAPERKYYMLGKMACEQCPVRKSCLRDGEEEEFGLWGGLTPRERSGRDEVKFPTKVLPPRYVRLLASMGDHPDIPALHERVKPFLEKRPKVVVDLPPEA